MRTVAVLGSGGWGTAIAVLLALRDRVNVILWSAHEGTAAAIQAQRENTRQLPGVKLPARLTITADVDTLNTADVWVCGIPTAFLRETLTRIAPLAGSKPVISLTKGLENGTFLRPSEVIRQVLGERTVAVLSGPSHAEEVARGKPTSLAVACTDSRFGSWIQEEFGTERFRVYTNQDLLGVELGGALKNVIGIAAGICDGLGFGDNAKSALVTRGLVEVTRFGVAHGADPSTFTGLAGLGDLITTCFSPHGRNRRVGERLAHGESLAMVTSGPQVAEGVYTARSVHDRISGTGIETPIMSGVYDMLYCGKPPAAAVAALMARQPKPEQVPAW
jgi:glycerol-3-phosphate dehydrogenase (NAD(P)+)